MKFFATVGVAAIEHGHGLHDDVLPLGGVVGVALRSGVRLARQRRARHQERRDTGTEEQAFMHGPNLIAQKKTAPEGAVSEALENLKN